MTVQTQGQQVFTPVRTKPVRGVRAIVLGLAAIIAAGTGIGIAVSAGDARPNTVIAPAAVPQTAPQAEQRDALQRLQENNQSPAQDLSRAEAYERMERATWAR